MSLLIGGANRTDFFSCDPVAGTMGATAVYTSRQKLKSTISRSAVEFEQNDMSATFTTWAAEYAPVASSDVSDSGQYEDGTKFNSLTAASPAQVAVTFGAVNPDDGKRYWCAHVVKLGQEVGSVTFEAGKAAKPQIKGEVVNLTTALTIDAAVFPATLFATPSAQVITAGKGFADGWLDEA